MHPSMCCLLILLLLSQWLHAQEERTVKGILLDSIENSPIEKCTVQLLEGKDKSQKKLSDAKGLFSFTTKADTVILLFQHVGYTEKRINIYPQKNNKTVDSIFLSPVDKLMDGIVVKTKVPPIVVREDTTEFNIDSSMFEPYDVVEDLLRRLPGLEIDAEGKLLFQGKPISRILVDGEDLFGGDATFSLKKLPAGMVAKIQVMDTKTLEQLFNGTPSDGEDKTLNIKLKEGNKIFGSGDATVGTKNQLEGNGMLSLFDGPRKVSVMGTLGSSNKIGLSNYRSGPSSSFSNASGNYSNRWGILRFNSSYGYNENGNTNRLYRERTQVITADTSFFTKAGNESDFSTSGHRFNISGNLFIDSSSSLDINLSLGTSKSNSKSNALSSTWENGSLRNESENRIASLNNQQNIGGSFSWMKRLNRKGRSVMISGRFNTAEQEGDQYSLSLNTYFKNNLPVSGDSLNRLTKTTASTKSSAVNFNYSEPLGKDWNVNIRGGFDFNNSSNNREIFNLDSSNHIKGFDSLYSAKIGSLTNTQNLNASLSYRAKKWNVNTGMTTFFQQAIRNLQGKDLRQDFLRYAPSVSGSWFPAKGKTLTANFSATTQQPSLEQLQPVPDNSNPLYIRLGNPNLKTSFSQSYGLNYNFSEAGTKTSPGTTLTIGIGYSPTSNQIVNAIFYDEYRRQTSQYINVNGVYTMRGNVSLSKYRSKEKTYQSLMASLGANYGQQVYFQANQLYYSRSQSTSINLNYSKRTIAVKATNYAVGINSGISRNWTPADMKILNTERFHFSPTLTGSAKLLGFIYANLSYQVSYTKINYHSSLRRNDEYSLHQVNNGLNFQILKKVYAQSNISYQYNTSVPEGTPNGAFNCNLSAYAQLWHGKGTVNFTASDLFAQSQNLRRVVGENYIEDVQMDNLRNYFTLKFQYNFNKLEKREKKK